MRAWLLLALLVAAPLTGCIGDGTNGDDLDPNTVVDPALGFPVPPTSFTHLVCEGDTLVELASDHSADCNQRATHDSGPAAEVHLAVNPLDPMNLVGGSKDFTLGEDARCGMYNVWSGVYWSKDGGRTWTHDLLPGHPGDERTTVLSDYACGSDPVVAFGPDGTAYYVSIHMTLTPVEDDPTPQLRPVLGYPIENAALAVTRSLDGGETWEDPVLLAATDDGSLIDKEWAAVDANTGQVYVTGIWRGDFFVWRSDDLGLTWTEPMLLVPASDGINLGHQFGQVTVTPDSLVHFTYWSDAEPGLPLGLYHRSSSDGGETWSEPHRAATFEPVFDLEITHKYRIVPNPALASGPRSGALYLSYPFYVGDTPLNGPGSIGVEVADHVPRGNLDVFVVASHDGGETWSEPVRVNDDLVAPLNGQWMQAIAVGPDGTVHVTWLDQRDDPTGQWAYVYHAYSTDGGRTWSDNARVSDVPFDGEGGYHQSGAGTIGDYMGLAVSPLAVHPFWADTRDGRNDVFGAILPAGSG